MMVEGPIYASFCFYFATLFVRLIAGAICAAIPGVMFWGFERIKWNKNVTKDGKEIKVEVKLKDSPLAMMLLRIALPLWIAAFLFLHGSYDYLAGTF